MRIVQINGGTKGSTGKIMFGIADIARKYGNEVICVSPITTTNRDKRNQDKFLSNRYILFAKNKCSYIANHRV